MQDYYFCFVEAFQHIVIRNFVTKVAKRVDLGFFPTCMTILEGSKVPQMRNSAEGGMAENVPRKRNIKKEEVLAALGT